jgi:hypothetical protein
MAAAERSDAWLERQRWREERMRFEVLAMLHDACGRDTGCIVRVADFAEGLGVWKEELFRTVEFLDRRGYLHYHGGGPSVSITQKGIDYIDRQAWRRRSIRE